MSPLTSDIRWEISKLFIHRAIDNNYTLNKVINSEINNNFFYILIINYDNENIGIFNNNNDS